MLKLTWSGVVWSDLGWDSMDVGFWLLFFGRYVGSGAWRFKVGGI